MATQSISLIILIYIFSVNIQMRQSYQHNQENIHPNTRVIEEDFSKISKQYILEGQRLKVKSFLHRENQSQ
jgi:hypothetical protein